MMRKFRLFGVLLLVLVLFPSRAFALDIWPNGSYWAGSTGDGNYASFVRADNLYDAAVYGLNEDPEKLTDEVKAKLSDPNYGGDFYTYAQTFYNVDSWESVPDWLPTYVMFSLTGAIHTWERVFASETASSLRQSALADYRRVLAGEDLGGGGGSSDESYTLFTLQAANADESNVSSSVIESQYFTAYNGYFDVDSGQNVLTGGTQRVSPWLRNSHYHSSMKIYVTSQVLEFLNSYISQGYEVIFAYAGASVFYIGRDFRIEYGTVGRTSMYRIYGTDIKMFEDPCTLCIDSESPYCYFHPDLNISLTSVSSPISNGYKSGDVIYLPFVSPPSGDWPEPETPVMPTAPEIPTPTAPTDTPDPTPTEPTVVWPTAPIVVNPPDVTVEVTPSGLDYTDLLTRINDNLNELNSYVQAINGSLNSLRSDIIGGFDDVVTSLRNIYQYLQHLNDILELHCKHLRDALDDGIYNLELYIKSLFEWLPQQLDFDANFDYDDSGIKSYLQRILNKIPGGATGTPQTYMPNPQADEPGFLDWLLDLWHRFLIDLVSVLPDELGGLVDAFSQLTHYFPFSIPWDLAALLALFEHEPVTPVFDVPWGFGGGDGEIEMVRVDLSAWDGVMEMVRPVFLVGFCWQLAMITKDLLANFDINKGGV